jgi:hypothetical protein
MKTLKGLIAFLFIFKGLLGYSQDLIIMKDGSKILCTIAKEDSLNIYYENICNTNALYTTIAKSQVEKYTYYNSVKAGNKAKSNSNSNAYMKEKESYSAKKGDTLALTNGGDILFKGRVLDQNEILEVMKDDGCAKQEMEKSFTYYNWLNKKNIKDINFDWMSNLGSGVNNVAGLVVLGGFIVAGVGVTYTVYGINKLTYKVRYNKYHKHLYNAVRAFNAIHRVT